MILAAALLAAPDAISQLPPASVTEVVSAAVDCFNATEAGRVNVESLVRSGWERHILPGEPTDLGQTYRRSGFNGEIAAVGPTCSLVAVVPSFNEVESVLTALDDAIHPDTFNEVTGGILLRKSGADITFFVGSPTTKKPAAVRVDIRRTTK